MQSSGRPENDPVLEELLRNSHLTRTQLQTLVSYQTRNHLRSGPYKATHRRPEKHVSKGSFHRSLLQARRNITRSLFTLITLGYLDITDTLDVHSFIELGQTVRELREAERTQSRDEAPLDALERVKESLQAAVRGMA